MTDFRTYYKQYFQRDLLNFVGQIPIKGNKHYDKQEFNIQYFFLTPNYKYLDIVPVDRQVHFAVALFWTVLIDQVFYSNFRYLYQTFQRKTLYPKFIGNCTAPSLMSSECGHHQHPRRILQAINDHNDKGNRFDFDREIFKMEESENKRERIDYNSILKQSKDVMREEIKDYFENHQPEIDWTEFWEKCKKRYKILNDNIYE
ncbi:MAG: hypothetical protein H8D45_24215 [Bacteroidetes bacterium]|nr:hypothetical protein [Bacteroidota bacterium]MBL7105381.1 hypothetical protein [Bacteroidales bacterium]